MGGLGLLDPLLRMKTLRVKVVNFLVDVKRKVMWKYLMELFIKKCGYFSMDQRWKEYKNILLK